jgi:hypothetical protein
MKNKILVVFLSALVFILTEINLTGAFLEFKRNYNSVFIEPLSYISLSIAISVFIIMFFSNEIFSKWLKIICWYAPVAFIFILSGSTGSSYTWISRVDFAILFGEILVVGTLIFALVQKFCYKK